ncbi:hypothetical protein [Actinomyces howellii]|uniref:Lipoprotein n=1 Tax=Actinomyces howellii TaxID=52771 RepID=A0A448HIG5_9ACTO|nr:hypothetical protein [Actinomyces howellii]VEG28934.1 Uncharacterised protein [Actinomyces howellii]
MAGARVAARRGRCVAGVVAVLMVSVVACSGSGGSGASASPSGDGSASATAAGSASGNASASAAGSVDPAQVTAESLSDEELGFIVTSIPDGLDAQEAEALVAYAAFERFTWQLWFSPAEPVEKIDGAEEHMTAESIPLLEQNYNAQDPGEYTTGPVRIAVASVQVWDTYQPAEAEIVVCMDRTELRDFSASGEEVTSPDSRGRFEYRFSLTMLEGPWKVNSQELISENQCVA